jgi:hypothetical protein
LPLITVPEPMRFRRVWPATAGLAFELPNMFCKDNQLLAGF